MLDGVYLNSDGAAIFHEAALKKIRRYNDGHEHEAYEAEALGQAYLTQVVRDALDEMLPEPLDRVLEREKKERVEVSRLLSRNGNDV